VAVRGERQDVPARVVGVATDEVDPSRRPYVIAVCVGHR